MVLITILTVIFILVAATLVLIILVQRPQGGGLAGAFGGAGGGSDTVFGGRTGDALTLATVVCFILFLSLSIGLNLIDVTPDRPGAGTPAGAATSTTLPTDGTNTDSIPLTPMPLPAQNSPTTPPAGSSEPSNTPIDPGTGATDPGAADPGTSDPGPAQPE